MQLHPRNLRTSPASAAPASAPERAPRTTPKAAAHAGPLLPTLGPLALLLWSWARDRYHALVLPTLQAAPLTAAIVASNLIIHAGVALGGPEAIDALWELGATKGERMFELWRLVASGWIHADAEHVISNVAMLAIVGRLLEPTVGTRRFALLYVAALLVSSVVSTVVYYDHRSAGASAAIYGVIGALLVVPVSTGLVRAIFVWAIAAAFVAHDFTTPAGAQIAVAGHIAGLVTGVYAAIFLGPGARATEPPDDPRVPVTTIVGAYSPALQAAVRAPSMRPRRRPPRYFWSRDLDQE